MNVNRSITLLSFCILFFFIDNSVNAQLTSFIHIQSENNNAFSVQWSGKIYPSSSSGYLVIPQIPAGEQVLIFGFQDTSLPAYTFHVVMDDKPRAFTLKQSVNNTWSLFDLVSFAITKGTVQQKEKAVSALLVISKPVESEKKPAIQIRDTTSQATATATIVTNAVKPARKPIKSVEPPIEKIFDKSNSAGIDQVYIVVTKGKTDTIAVFIPALKEENPKQSAFRTKQKKQKDISLVCNTAIVYSDRFKSTLNNHYGTVFSGTFL